MANIHVRQGASGSNNGTDWTNAYTTFPAMGAITRGDVIYIADTSSTLTIPTLSKALSSTTRISIKKATIADHGSATGWVDTYGDGVAVISKITLQTGYWTIDGQARTTIRSGHGFKLDGNTSPSSTTLIAVGDTGPTAAPNCVFRYMEVYGSADRTDTYHDSGLVTTVTGGSDALTLEYCWVHDVGSVGVALRFCATALVQYNVIERNQSSGVNHSEGFVLAQSSNLTIRWNIIGDMEGTGYIATPYASHNALFNIYLYGNVFVMESTPLRGGGGTGVVAVIDCICTGDFFIYSNTILGIQTSKISTGFGDNVTASPSFTFDHHALLPVTLETLYIRDNIWIDCDPVSDPLGLGAAVTTYAKTHSSYYNTTSTSDADSDKQIFVSDPLPNWETGNYTPTVDTATWFSLSSPYATDRNGIARTSSRGSDQYVGGGGGGFVTPISFRGRSARRLPRR